MCSKPRWNLVCVYANVVFTTHPLPIHQTWKTHEADTSPTLRQTHLHTTFANTHEVPSKFTTHYPTKKTLRLISTFSPLVTVQHTTRSNTRLVLLKMGIMIPETYWESIDNKHLTVASCWFSLSLHNLLTMHGHRNLKLTNRLFFTCNTFLTLVRLFLDIQYLRACSRPNTRISQWPEIKDGTFGFLFGWIRDEVLGTQKKKPTNFSAVYLAAREWQFEAMSI